MHHLTVSYERFPGENSHFGDEVEILAYHPDGMEPSYSRQVKASKHTSLQYLSTPHACCVCAFAVLVVLAWF